MSLQFYVSNIGASREVSIQRRITLSGSVRYEDGGRLAWDGNEFAWHLPHEAYMACVINPKELACIMGLLNWLNTR